MHPSITKQEAKSGKRFRNFYGKWEWYEPAQSSAPVHFCLDTSLHGLQYVGQTQRHVSERIFWLIAFTVAASISAVLIWHMWDSYVTTPIVTVFNPTEKTLQQIPYPAVTICNVNNVRLSKWNQYIREAELALNDGASNNTLLSRLASIHDILQICMKDKTFTTKFRNITKPNNPVANALDARYLEYAHLLNPFATLLNSSQTCREMIIFCLWLGEVQNCSDLFQEIATDFGICCAFNSLPVQLLIRYLKINRTTTDHVREWKEANINNDNLIFENQYKHRTKPYRQLYTGRSAGLSFLVDPELHEYHCSNTDSEGFVVGLNQPLDFPRMKDNGISIRTSSEMFISVTPEITITAESAKGFTLEQRQCYLDGENELEFYTRYTPSNCLDECIAKITLNKCKCLRYYMPSKETNTRTACTINEYGCTEKIREKIMREGLERECKHCWPTCSEILYHAETTSLRVQENAIKELLMEKHPNPEKVRNASIVHIYLNVDSVFPRLRKELYTTVDIISNAGGLLGLCMGFSMLSLLEICYHASLRLFCTKYRNHTLEQGTAEGITTVSVAVAPPTNNGKNYGFLSKLVHNRYDAAVQAYERREEVTATLPVYIRTAFESDFQRAYVSTLYKSEQMP